MMRLSLALAWVAITLSTSVIEANAQTRGGRQTATGWRLVRTVDEFTDKENLTAVLPSVDGKVSLRVYLQRRNWLGVFLTIPRSVRVTSKLDLVEIRFDKDEPEAFMAGP